MKKMSPPRPVVSVIIPTYNSAGTLWLAAGSVLRQDFEDWEAWVIGDECTDDSEDVVRNLGDGRFNWVNLSENSGTPSRPRNEGLRRANGRFIAYLGHDDLWFPWHLTELVGGIERSKSDFISAMGMLLAPDGVNGLITLPNREGQPKSRISPSSWLHRKSLVEMIGAWPTGIKFGDDREFLKRVLSSPGRVDTCRQVSVLKFPSAIWKMYGRSQYLPQTIYADRMQRDPEALRLELLLELAEVFSRKGFWLYPRATAGESRLREWVSRLIDVYGPYRWPVSWMLHRRWRRKSGLSPKG